MKSMRAVIIHSDLFATPTCSGMSLAVTILAILFAAGPAQARFAGDAGTGEDSYQLENVEPVKESDSLGLVMFYDGTIGEDWTTNTHWLENNQPVSTWYGVTVENQTVSELQLGNNNLAGALPPEIDLLSHLKRLHVQDNKLQGSLPSQLSNVTMLQELRVDGNPDLEGSIPMELTNLENLELFWFDGTGLCEPGDPVFRDWLDGIDDVRGTQLCDPADETQFAGGSGTGEDPYQIETVEQLQAIADMVNLDKHFILIADIDASETENWDNGKGFNPIGSWSSDPDNINTG